MYCRNLPPFLPRGVPKAPGVGLAVARSAAKRPFCLSAGELTAVLSEMAVAVHRAYAERFWRRISGFGRFAKRYFLPRLAKETARRGMSGRRKTFCRLCKSGKTVLPLTCAAFSPHCGMSGEQKSFCRLCKSGNTAPPLTCAAFSPRRGDLFPHRGRNP